MAGGVPAIMKELTKRGLLDLSLITATGRTVGRTSRGVVKPDPNVRPHRTTRIPKPAVLPFLWGNIAKKWLRGQALRQSRPR